MTNGQSAFPLYQRDHDRAYQAYPIAVPTVTAIGTARIVTFVDPGLLGLFGLSWEMALSEPAAIPRSAAGLYE